MKSILTITCHNVYNHGATLQEYALLTHLRSLGFEANSIRYKPKYLSRHFNLWNISNSKFDKPIIKQLYLLYHLPKRLNYLKRKRSFDRFNKQHLNYTGKIYASNHDLKLNPPEADVYICGSDQIWNHLFENGKDLAFYLDFAPKNKKKIAYAASLATNYIPESLETFYRYNLSKLDYVSVREISSVELLNKIDIKNIKTVMDPVFLLDAETWKRRFLKPINEKYILVYDFDNNTNIQEIALNMKKNWGYKIYTMNSNIKYADKNFWQCAPCTFLSLIYYSKFTLTNSFHAISFSIIFEKKFLVFERVENINARLHDILDLFGIRESLLCTSNSFDLQNYELNYAEIREKKEKLIAKSKDFLIKAIQE